MINGKIIDQEGRCEHYHTQLDIIANKCKKCGEFWACYQCHDELADHQFVPYGISEADTVMCGHCQTTFSYQTYENLIACSGCQHQFNPRCALHKAKYINS